MRRALSLQTKKKLFETLGESKTMALATANTERVSVRNMSAVLHEEKIYFQTDILFRKCCDFSHNTYVAFCADNIQIEGEVTAVYRWEDEEMSAFRRLFKKHYPSSCKAYSKLMNNRIFEVTPNWAQIYCYSERRVDLKRLDFKNEKAVSCRYL